VCLITTFYDLVFQLDIFEHVGVPLVENCLAGFNSSVFAYGQVSFFSLYFLILLHFCYSARFDAIYAFIFEIVRRGVGRLLQCGVRPILWPEKM
jgi:hypothetical protein